MSEPGAEDEKVERPRGQHCVKGPAILIWQPTLKPDSSGKRNGMLLLEGLRTASRPIVEKIAQGESEGTETMRPSVGSVEMSHPSKRHLLG